MKRLEEDLPPGAVPAFDLDRGQEVVFVTSQLTFSSWRAPYCGPRRFEAPRFRATEAQLDELEKQLLARAPGGSQAKALRCSEPDADGAREWTLIVPVVTSNYNLGD